MPGGGRYSVTFQTSSGAEHSIVAQVTRDDVTIATSTLPSDWQADGPAHAQLVLALLAVDRARGLAQAPAELLDVDGGWDVMIGNVLLEAGVVTCAAHGPMELDGSVWRCLEPNCGAQALYAAQL